MQQLADSSQLFGRHVKLATHPTARNQALATNRITPGTTILTAPALSHVLLLQEKGRRCDACCRLAIHTSAGLKRCSGCTAYWYCGSDCQTRHWKTVHRFMCKNFNRYQASQNYQRLPPHRQLDSLLLSHLIAEHLHSEDLPADYEMSGPLSVFLSLLPQSTDNMEEHLAVCPVVKMHRPSNETIQQLCDRFGNNNFVVHSHLTSIAHAIFPLASRLFNHSCTPNAVTLYNFNPDGLEVRIEPLTTIEEGEEITIPYLDSALPLQVRQQTCRISYGFSCNCRNCLWCQSRGPIVEPPKDASTLAALELSFYSFVFPTMPLRLPTDQCLYYLPETFTVFLHESYLPKLSSTFSGASHDGPFDVARYSGKILLALYVTVYPPKYPLVGVHCLEMAKVTWNHLIKEEDGLAISSVQEALSDIRSYLGMAKNVLKSLGDEGDDGGPLQEIDSLEQMLNER